jgi:hypothetical protein
MRSQKVSERFLERRAKVAKLLAMGVTNKAEIARRIGRNDKGSAGRKMVHGDVAAIRAEWKQSATFDYGEMVGRQLARLEWLYAEQCKAWEESKEVKESVRKKTTKRCAPRGGGMVNNATEEEVKTEKMPGDPRYAKNAIECLRRMAELMGLVAKTGDEDRTPPVVGIDIYLPPGYVPPPGVDVKPFPLPVVLETTTSNGRVST